MKKKCLIILLFSITYANNFAQSENVSLTHIQSAVDACIAISNAVATNDTSAMKESAKMLRECKIEYFYNLHCLDSIPISLNGHLVFDDVFIDRMNKGENVYECADEFVRKQKVMRNRGQTADGSIRARTCLVKKGASTKYKFTSKGHQELAVVAEAGGLLTMKIRVTNRDGLDKRYDDTTNVKTGLPHRQASFDLPENRLNFVELEVINCGKKDCSFVIINN